MGIVQFIECFYFSLYTNLFKAICYRAPTFVLLLQFAVLLRYFNFFFISKVKVWILGFQAVCLLIHSYTTFCNYLVLFHIILWNRNNNIKVGLLRLLSNIGHYL